MRSQLTLRRWSGQEDRYVQDNFMTVTVSEMAVHLGRTAHAVRGRKTILGLAGKQRPWQQNEIEGVRALYEQSRSLALDLPEVSRRMGRSVVAISIKARHLGLTDQRRPHVCRDAWTAEEDMLLRTHPDLFSTEFALILHRSPKAIVHRRAALGCPLAAEGLRTALRHRKTRFVHPRGFKGRKHSVQTRQRVSVASRAMWARHKEMGSGLMSDENRQAQSDLMSQRQATDPRLRRAFSRAASGTRADLGFYVRSRWEANVARYLKWLQERGEIYSWAYESTTFWFEHIKRGTRSYTPDFEIIEKPGATPHFWEVKGWRHPRGETALARMARYYPEVRITVIDKEAYKAIAKWKALLPYWETSND